MPDRLAANPAWIVPEGTTVVIYRPLPGTAGAAPRPAGAVGVIAEAPADPTHSYLVRFPDGGQAPLRRVEFAIQKHFREPGLAVASEAIPFAELYDFVIYRCVVGSRAYGLDEEGSDWDRRGIYLPPADRHWALAGVPEQLENPATQETYWELHKFLTLALKANPNILECLYTPLVEHAAPLAEELLAMRAAFLSRLVYQTYNGYVLSQFKKLSRDLRNQGTLRWKHAMHLIRLLIAGITILRDGTVPVRVPDEHRDRLLALRRGELRWEEVNAWRLRLHADFDAALPNSPLPERPDYEAADRFLIRARRSKLER